jgi:hypothetical protein
MINTHPPNLHQNLNLFFNLHFFPIFERWLGIMWHGKKPCMLMEYFPIRQHPSSPYSMQIHHKIPSTTPIVHQLSSIHFRAYLNFPSYVLPPYFFLLACIFKCFHSYCCNSLHQCLGD